MFYIKGESLSMFEEFSGHTEYDEWNWDMLIFAGGELPDLDGEALKRDVGEKTLVMCADSGLDGCVKYGISPDYVVGDMDSVDPEVLNCIEGTEGTNVERFAVEKDFTDLELVMLKAVDLGAVSICVLGALGGRLDQTMANISMACRFAEEYGLRLKLCGKCEDVYVLTSFENEVCVKGTRGQTLSLLAAREKVEGITLTGFKYPLIDASLEYGQTLGISNKLEEDRVIVSMRSGTLIVVHEKVLGL